MCCANVLQMVVNLKMGLWLRTGISLGRSGTVDMCSTKNLQKRTRFYKKLQERIKKKLQKKLQKKRNLQKFPKKNVQIVVKLKMGLWR